ncbi:MAG: hypothetical protein ACRDJ9_19430 [Dehalococcoidia bacterium]
MTRPCWGRNFEGQLGDESVAGSNAPVPVAGGLTFVAASAGFAHTCGVTTTGATYCWGSNASGQVGDGSTDNRTVPVRVIQ